MFCQLTDLPVKLVDKPFYEVELFVTVTKKDQSKKRVRVGTAKIQGPIVFRKGGLAKSEVDRRDHSFRVWDIRTKPVMDDDGTVLWKDGLEVTKKEIEPAVCRIFPLRDRLFLSHNIKTMLESLEILDELLPELHSLPPDVDSKKLEYLLASVLRKLKKYPKETDPVKAKDFYLRSADYRKHKPRSRWAYEDLDRPIPKWAEDDKE